MEGPSGRDARASNKRRRIASKTKLKGRPGVHHAELISGWTHCPCLDRGSGRVDCRTRSGHETTRNSEIPYSRAGDRCASRHCQEPANGGSRGRLLLGRTSRIRGRKGSVEYRLYAPEASSRENHRLPALDG